MPKKIEPRNREERRHPDLSVLLKELPPWVLRTHGRFKELTGYSPRSFANMDSLGLTAGVKRVRIGRSVAYERESLVKWLEDHATVLS